MPANLSDKNPLSARVERPVDIVIRVRQERFFSFLEELRALIRHAIATIEEVRLLVVEIHDHLSTLPVNNVQIESLLTVAEAARRLSVNQRTVRRLGDEGELDLVKRGRIVRVIAESVDTFIARNRGI